jgi:SAM-dependent methyltransferase
MAEDSQQTVVAGVGDTLAAIAPDVVRRLKDGIDVLDAGCGAGRAAIRMAELFPRSRFVGFDLCEDAIEMARDEAGRRAVSNVSFDVVDLASFDAPARFDVITSFDAVHDTKDPQALLRMYWRALRAGGVHVMQDIGGSAHLENNVDFPLAPFLYTASCIHCTPVSLAQGGAGLGTMWGWETAEEMLKNAGFAKTERFSLPHDPMNVWFVSRK